LYPSLLIWNERQKDIASGAVYVGRKICPITFSVPRGTAYQDKIVFGRIISLDHIRSRHLQMMGDLGVLRNTEVDSLSYNSCKKLLSEHKGLSHLKIATIDE
jgi:hypothetical protein